MWYNDNKNIGIFGPTQNGKTTFANNLHGKSNRIGVFFNHDDEPFVTGVPARNVREVIAQMSNGQSKIDLQMAMFETNAEEKLESIVKTLMVMGEKNNAEFIFTIDEAHEFAPEGSRNTPVHLAAKRGLKRGMKCQVITQDPATLSNSVTRQMDYLVWVGPASPQSINYMRERMNIDNADVFGQNNQYEYKVLDRNGNVIDSGRVSG
jgi:hypothetical protein